ncbi:MAG: glycosyltransferase [Gammaproteobacteria bacterium]
MGTREQLEQIKRYLRKHQSYPYRIGMAPSAALDRVVVIPCHDEPTLIPTLQALWACRRGPGDVEVIIVVNAAKTDPLEVHRRNEQTFAEAKAWILARETEASYRGMAFHLLGCHDLPRRQAGVGLARKIGMDAAVERFCCIGRPDGVVASLDADCTCDPDYLQQMAAHFALHRTASGCSIYFEHPLDDAADETARRAIVNYELFLRYYKNGLRQAGSPYARYTLGSCMAVRSGAYAQQGGMNRRRAGEDFYFLQKFMGCGRLTELGTTRVLPSPRVSHRVPFGTGRAIRDQLSAPTTPFLTYAPPVFRDLRTLFGTVVDFFDSGRSPADCVKRLPLPMAEFLRRQGFVEQVVQMRQNAASPRTFLKRFHQWFNGLMTLKYVRWATTTRFGWMPIEQAAAVLLRSEDAGQRFELRPSADAEELAEQLLYRYRWRDRVRACSPSRSGATDPEAGVGGHES